MNVYMFVVHTNDLVITWPGAAMNTEKQTSVAARQWETWLLDLTSEHHVIYEMDRQVQLQITY